MIVMSKCLLIGAARLCKGRAGLRPPPTPPEHSESRCSQTNQGLVANLMPWIRFDPLPM